MLDRLLEVGRRAFLRIEDGTWVGGMVAMNEGACWAQLVRPPGGDLVGAGDPEAWAADCPTRRGAGTGPESGPPRQLSEGGRAG